MLKITKIESLMSKVELIYLICTQSLQKELHLFWKDFDIPKKDLMVDSDNLQGLMIYIISRANYPQLWAELHLIEEFLP